MIVNRRLCATWVWAVMACGCATTSPFLRQQCYNPDVLLANVLQPLEAQRAKGCEVGVAERGLSECDRLRQELDRLVVVCAGHAPTLFASAVVAYDEHQPVKSQQLLDQVLSQQGRFPDAAVLRARIAIEEGNVSFARRLLEQHIRLVPDHAELHETYGATLYVERRLPEAERELARAQALGAPRWRIAYHLGLVEEASGRRDEARRHYTEALEGNPGWAPAQSRLNGLRADAASRP